MENQTINTLRLPWWSAVLAAVVLNGDWRNAVAAVPQVYAGSSASSSFLVNGSGALNAWGENGLGNLGIGGYADQPNPATVPFPSGVHGWREVAAASGSTLGSSTYAIGDDSQLYGAGNISFSYHQSMTLIPPPAGVGGWAAVAASGTGWLAVSTNGPIYGIINGSISWPPRPGATRWAQVAVGSYSSPSQPDLFALDNRGKLYGFYSGTAWFPSPTVVEIPVPAGATAWTNITAGAYHVLALANDGNLYGWGHNESGMLGQGFFFVYTNTPLRIALPAGKTGWKAISAGGTHSMATTTDGQLFVWGANGYGQLGLGATGPNHYSPTAVPNLTNVTAIAAGYGHSLAVVNCQVLAWGNNANGELGAGFTSPYYPLPLGLQFNYDLCSTNPPPLPLVSVTASDPNASEGTWLSTLGQPATNTGRFEISRAVTTASSLEVKLSIGGTASNSVDYLAIPSTITIPANSNSVSLLVVPTGSTLVADPSTVVVNLLADPTYQFGNSTTATVTLIQYESQTTIPPLPGLQLQLFVGTNLNGQVFVIQSSTNLFDWSDLGTGTNVYGVVTVSETNRFHFRQRFFRAFPLSGG